MDYQTVSLQVLKDEFVRLAGIVVAASEERRLIELEINRRVAAIKAQERLRRLDAHERDALKEALKEEIAQ